MMILLNNLTIGSSYTARVAAMTRVGLGPYSGAVPIFMDPYVTSNVSASRSGLEYWFFAITALFVLTVVVGIVLLVYLKKRQRSEKTLGHFDGKIIFRINNQPPHSCLLSKIGLPPYQCFSSSVAIVLYYAWYNLIAEYIVEIK